MKNKSVRLRVPAPPHLCGRFPREGHLHGPVPLGFGEEKRMTAFPFRLCPHATDSALGAAPYDVAAQE